MRTIFATLLLSLSAMAQPSATNYTHGYLNGRYWTSLKDGQQVFLVLGYAEAFRFYGEAKFPEQFPVQLPYGDVVKGLTRLYEEPENLAIPIIHGMVIFSMKAHGDPPDSVNSVLRTFRQMATSPDPPAKN